MKSSESSRLRLGDLNSRVLTMSSVQSQNLTTIPKQWTLTRKRTLTTADCLSEKHLTPSSIREIKPMNVLNTVFNNQTATSDLFERSLGNMPGLPNVQPLWKNIEKTQATVTETIAPNTLGRVKFQGTRWRAWSNSPLTTGTAVRVIGRQRSNILIVEPVYAVA
ncbi:MAG: NfeD family protein [Leptolyngbya sp. SIO1E4]|nr:NfeD family protein [Leptolyngbya sp. SIO1E4]